jgi:hypothetical protein
MKKRKKERVYSYHPPKKQKPSLQRNDHQILSLISEKQKMQGRIMTIIISISLMRFYSIKNQNNNNCNKTKKNLPDNRYKNDPIKLTISPGIGKTV